jgi:hypothetical protein
MITISRIKGARILLGWRVREVEPRPDVIEAKLSLNLASSQGANNVWFSLRSELLAQPAAGMLTRRGSDPSRSS